MDRTALMEMRKAIDFAFRDFSRTYGDGIEAFFDPLLFFLVGLEKLIIFLIQLKNITMDQKKLL